ncbi:EamA family transporter RarD [Ornithinibacillus sp. BX22]|uniref:EamA family transporter RarD n=2 Tax=Ornithinibacillus TaxID=484508 RepID=A0A923RFM8_9BACI|nr:MULTISPECIES: EamA family transporter RarD [Ornithinibacillus]MBC5635554.1 EamA family transporter RarD [Ornithinibacillus hominis]MBS3679164.1 EamA family transporter RarD [Ornithinibacillus massiliensis]
MEQKSDKIGMLYAVFAYVVWGLLPIYWKLIEEVPAGEILAHRIVWSFVFMIVVVLSMRKWQGLGTEWKRIVKDKKKLISITLASVVISLNWLVYIWAVNSDHMLQASLGYYINPLVSILLAIIVLKEKLTKSQTVSVILAGVGVLYLTVSYGVFPWVSLFLAVSFALYGLFKKMVDIPAMYGLTIETLIITPIALIYLFLIPENSFSVQDITSMKNLLLIGAGAMTAIPLLLFASGAKRIPLAMVGILQYIAPTLMLLIGVFIYHETFTREHLIAFSFIWLALVIYLGSIYRFPMRKMKMRDR